MAEEFVVSVTFRGNDQMSRPAASMNQQLQGLARTQKDVTTNTQNASREMGLFGTAVAGALTFATVSRVIDFAEEMNALGREVNATSKLFEHFGGNAEVLEDLRRATHGLASDFELMKSSADLMNLGITQNIDDATRLIGMIEAVKKPTQELDDAVNEFSLLLANNSYLRLDTFGISSARVRERVEELKNSLNLDTSAAFFQATMEALQEKVDGLGDAAFRGESALSRLQVRLENVGNTAAAKTNDIVEFYAAIAEGGLDTTETLFDYGQRLREGLRALYPDRFNVIADIVSPNLVFTPEEQANALRYMWIQERIRDGFKDIVEQGKALVGRWGQAREAADAHRRQLLDFYAEFRAMPDTLTDVSPYETFLDIMSNQRRGMVNGIQLFTAEEAGRARGVADALEHMASNIDALKPYVETGLISADALEHMQDIADDARRFADEAERGARALENLTLADVFGQTSGGLFGQIEDRILQTLESRGVPAAELERLRTSLDLTAGRETNLSLAFEHDVLPLLEDIYRSEGATGLNQAIANLTSQITTLTQQGIALDPATLAELTGYRRIEGGGQTIVIRPGDTAYSVQARYPGVSLEDIMATGNGRYIFPGEYQIGGGVEQISAISTAVESMAENAPVAATAFSGINEDASALRTTMDTVKSILDEIAGASYRLTVDLDVRYPAILDVLMGGANTLAQIVRANGGVVPGADTRTRAIAR